MNETMVTVTGNIITDVRARRTADGTRIASFRMASNERRFDRESGQWIDGDRLYLSVTCWRRLAEGVLATLGKGDPVVATGRLYTRGYEVDGQKRSITELDAYTVGPDLARCWCQLRRPRREESVTAAETGAQVTADNEQVDTASATTPQREDEIPEEVIEDPDLTVVGAGPG